MTMWHLTTLEDYKYLNFIYIFNVLILYVLNYLELSDVLSKLRC